jgi:Gpi18-like mannosyltransferase
MIHLSKKFTINNSQAINILFPVLIWLSSRLAIAIALLFLAPLLPTPPDSIPATFSWKAFSAWDSLWYQRIATFGYDYAPDNKQHSIAFFPLFPLTIHLLMMLGLPFEVAGILVSNVTFLAALVVLYFWVAEHHGKSAAMWSTAALAWCPYSLYGTVIYTEGLFFLCSTAALRAFDKKQHLWAAFWGALATATRVSGAMLIPSFLFVAWKQRRGIQAYLASLAAGGGLFLFGLYCQIRFGDALAFFHAQKAWRPSFGFAEDGWWDMVMQIVVGERYDDNSIVNFWHPLLFAMIICSGFLLWRFRAQLGVAKMRYGLCLLWLLLWFLTYQPLPYDPFSSDPLVKLTLIFGGIALLWFSRGKVPLVAVVYGFCSYGLIFNTGLTASVERYAYGIVSLSFAFGLLLARYPRWGYPVILFFAFPLLNLSVRFAHKLWVA